MHLFNISVRKERYLSKINKLAYLTVRFLQHYISLKAKKKL